jgi:outer membrane protein OmpU
MYFSALQFRARRMKYGAFPLRIPLRRAYLEERGKNMKKVLLATSALVMFAGAASAEISLSGSARMGIVHVDSPDAGVDVTQFSSRVRIVFTASGETDGGLAFGASVRNDQSGQGGTENGDSTVFISGGFGKLTMGDVGGAADALVGQVSGVGYGPNDDTQEIKFLGTVKTAVYYEYSAGALTFGLGIGQNDAEATFLGLPIGEAQTYNIGVKYATDAYSAALGWETIDAAGGSLDMISLGGSATFGPVTVKARISDLDVSGFDTAYALSADYVTGPLTLTAFYTDYGNSTLILNPYDFGPGGLDLGFSDPDVNHIGLGVAYDLGGGATVAGGITRQNNSVFEDVTIANAGLKFSF